MSKNKTVDARKVVEHRAGAMHIGIVGMSFLGLATWVMNIPWPVLVVAALVLEIAGYYDFRNHVHKLGNKTEGQ